MSKLIILAVTLILAAGEPAWRLANEWGLTFTEYRQENAIDAVGQGVA